MSTDIFSGLHNAVPEDNLPEGHLQRFENRLNSLSKIRSRFWLVQRVAVAASIAAFIALSFIVTLNLEKLRTRKIALHSISSELYETELYLAGKVEEKMEILNAGNTLDKTILEDIREIDKSYNEIKRELLRNPYDDRLISAVLETYQVKLEILDEILSR